VENFIERHSSKIKGVISCFDRIVLTGTIPGICYAQGMSSFLTTNGVRIFDFTQWADPLREEIRVIPTAIKKCAPCILDLRILE
jgi:hypothetical protein